MKTIESHGARTEIKFGLATFSITFTVMSVVLSLLVTETIVVDAMQFTWIVLLGYGFVFASAFIATRNLSPNKLK